jgi:hypothetical protein
MRRVNPWSFVGVATIALTGAAADAQDAELKRELAPAIAASEAREALLPSLRTRWVTRHQSYTGSEVWGLEAGEVVLAPPRERWSKVVAPRAAGVSTTDPWESGPPAGLWETIRTAAEPNVFVFDGGRTLSVHHDDPRPKDGARRWIGVVRDGFQSISRSSPLECGLLAQQQWMSAQMRRWSPRCRVTGADARASTVLFVRDVVGDRAWLSRVTVSREWQHLVTRHIVTSLRTDDIRSVTEAFRENPGQIQPSESLLFDNAVLSTVTVRGKFMPAHVTTTCPTPLGSRYEAWLEYTELMPADVKEKGMFSVDATPREYAGKEGSIRDEVTGEVRLFPAEHDTRERSEAGGTRYDRESVGGRGAWRVVLAVVGGVVALVIAALCALRAGVRRVKS